MRIKVFLAFNRASFIVVLAILILSLGAVGEHGQSFARELPARIPDIISRPDVATSHFLQTSDWANPAMILAQAFSSDTSAQAERAVIRRINKASAKAGELITLEMHGFPTSASDSEFLVIIGGYTALPEPGSGPGLLIVRVPPELTEAVETSDVFVRFSPNFDPELVQGAQRSLTIRYEGDFSIVQSTSLDKLIIYFGLLESNRDSIIIGFVFFVISIVFICGFILLYFQIQRRRLQQIEQGTIGFVPDSGAFDIKSTGPDDDDEPAFTLDPPVVPDGLVTIMAQGDCVAFAGAGMSAQAGLPIWRNMLAKVIAGLQGKEQIQDDFAERLVRLLSRGELEDAADALVTARGFDLSLALSLIQETLDGFDAKPSDAHRELVQLPMSALLTTNYDDLLEQIFVDRKPAVVTPLQANAGLDALSQGKFFLLKLSGVLDQPGSAILSPRQHVDMVRDSPVFNDLLDRIILSRTILFVGVSLDGIEEFFRGVSSSSRKTGVHFALVAAEDDGWEIKASTLYQLYGVRVLPFAFDDRAVAVADFLGELRSRVTEYRKQFEGSAPLRSAGGRSFLSCVELTNVGPFAELSFDLDKTWNLFLGDNGVGKSTILKAITVGLIGRAAQPWAGRIIKSGKEKATVVLHTDTRQSHKTTITRGSDGTIVIDSGSLTALAAESWLALGFPALRTATWERSRSEPSLGIGRPMAGDLLPLITDEPDPRLDGLKQQIVRLWGSKNTRGGRTDVNYDGLMKDLKDLFKDVLADMPIEIRDVDPNTDEITVLTADGEVPFESVSQGTTSLIAWCGVLLQRLYETAGPNDEYPKERYALVMIDELDAHMHPMWQNGIVSRLKGVFPNVQFLAATHSPLVVRGMEMDCIKRFKRSAKGSVEIVEVPDDMTMGRADQVLASELFDTAAHDPITEELIAEYHALLRKENREPSEEEKLQELEDVMQFRIPVPEITPRDRRASEVFTDLLEAQMTRVQHDSGEDEETVKVMARGRKRLRKRAQELLEQVERSQKD